MVNYNDVIVKISDLRENETLTNPIIRYASRGILIKDNKIALLHKRVKNEYKLPGGGVESNENFEETLIRELYEETGCNVEIKEYLGIAIEEKKDTNFKQISKIYVAEVLEDLKKLHLTSKERKEGSEVIWVSLQEAIFLVNKAINELKGSMYDSLYQSMFMVKRDLEILKYYDKQKNHATIKK